MASWFVPFWRNTDWRIVSIPYGQSKPNQAPVGSLWSYILNFSGQPGRGGPCSAREVVQVAAEVRTKHTERFNSHAAGLNMCGHSGSRSGQGLLVVLGRRVSVGEK